MIWFILLLLKIIGGLFLGYVAITTALIVGFFIVCRPDDNLGASLMPIAAMMILLWPILGPIYLRDMFYHYHGMKNNKKLQKAASKPDPNAPKGPKPAACDCGCNTLYDKKGNVLPANSMEK